MRCFHALLFAILALVAGPAPAQVIAYEPVASEQIVWLNVGGARYVQFARARVPEGVAAYGPFRVLDPARAALVDVTDAASPRAFVGMLRDYPGIATLEIVACPGTEDDRANLVLGAMIRARGIATHVPDGGIANSGAVELFLAGKQRRADPGARFGVHSWQDITGLEPRDYPPDAPKNRAYLDYYQTVGLSAQQARAFYAMTNAVPFGAVKWLTAADLAKWVRLDPPAPLPRSRPADNSSDPGERRRLASACPAGRSCR